MEPSTRLTLRVRPRHPSAVEAALAYGSTSGGFQFQDGHPGDGLPITVRHGHGSSLSGCRLSVGLRRQSSWAAFCLTKIVCCETNLQELWKQMFCRFAVILQCRSQASLWNGLPADLRKVDISFQRFERLLKIFLFGCRDRGALIVSTGITVKDTPHKFY